MGRDSLQRTILTQRLMLRPVNGEDLDAVFAIAQDAEATRYMLFYPHKARSETETFLAQAEAEWKKADPDFYEFAVTLKGKQIGIVSLYWVQGREEAELGWLLHRDYWNRGFATEAAAAVRDFALGPLGARRIIAECDARNKASYRVMQKIGLKLERADGFRTYRDGRGTARELLCSLEPAAFSVE